MGSEEIKESIVQHGIELKEKYPNQDLDIGFRVLRLDSSNHEGNKIKPDRSDLDLLFEAMLAWGFTLDLPLQTDTVDGCTIFTVNNGELVACFAENVTDDALEAIALKNPQQVVFRDSCTGLYDRIKQRMGWSEDEAFTDVKTI